MLKPACVAAVGCGSYHHTSERDERQHGSWAALYRFQSTEKLVSSSLAFISMAHDGQVETRAYSLLLAVVCYIFYESCVVMKCVYCVCL